MNPPLIAAAVLIVSAGVAHSYLGERYLLIRLLRRSDLPKLKGDDSFTKQTLRFAWHLTTVEAVGLAVVLMSVGGSEPTAVGARHGIAATCAAGGLLSLVAVRGRHLSRVVLFAIAALIWLA